MKVVVDGIPLFEVNEIQKKVLANDIHKDEVYSDMQRRMKWVIEHKYKECFKRLKAEWDVKLKENGVKNVPTDEEEYAALVFEQPNYRCKASRNEEITFGKISAK